MRVERASTLVCNDAKRIAEQCEASTITFPVSRVRYDYHLESVLSQFKKNKVDCGSSDLPQSAEPVLIAHTCMINYIEWALSRFFIKYKIMGSTLMVAVKLCHVPHVALSETVQVSDSCTGFYRKSVPPPTVSVPTIVF